MKKSFIFFYGLTAMVIIGLLATGYSAFVLSYGIAAWCLFTLAVIWLGFFDVKLNVGGGIRVPSNAVYIAFVFLCFMLYLSFALTNPYGNAPDETMRYDIVRFIFENGRLPIGNEPEIVNPLWGQSYAYQPILAYQIMAFFVGIFSKLGVSESSLYFVARGVNIFIATGTATLVFAIGIRVFKLRYGLVFSALVCLLPQFAFISSYINNDTLAMFSAALIFYSWVRGLKEGFHLKIIILLGVGISLCFLSYYNAYGFILATFFLYLGDYFINRRQRSFKQFFGYGLIILCICGVLAGWWFVRSYLIHDGDIFGMQASSRLAETLAAPEFKPSVHLTPQREGISLAEMIFGEYHENKWLIQTMMSFIGSFGYVNINLDGFAYFTMVKMYLFLGICFLLSLPGVLKKKGFCNTLLWLLILLLTILTPVILSLYYSYTSDYQPQGRYIMPMLIPLMYCLTTGAKWLGEGSQLKFLQNFSFAGLNNYQKIHVVHSAKTVIDFCKKYLPAVLLWICTSMVLYAYFHVLLGYIMRN